MRALAVAAQPLAPAKNSKGNFYEGLHRARALHPRRQTPRQGTIIVESDRVAELEGSDHDHHLIPTHLPEHHELVVAEKERQANAVRPEIPPPEAA